MAIEIGPRFDGAHTDPARSLEAIGRFDEARERHEEGRRLSGGSRGHPSVSLTPRPAQATGLVFLRVHPRLDSVRADPRYLPLLRRVGLALVTGFGRIG